MLAQWMPEPVPQFPTDAIIADWEYRPADAPEVHPDDSVSQAGRRLIAPHHDLDVEDYRQDYGLRMSSRKHDLRRNRHRSAQHDRRYIKVQQRRVSPAPSPPDPSPVASRANSDPGPPPTPAPSPPPAQPTRNRRASKRRSECDAPDPLCSGQTRDRRLGRSSAKTRRSPTPPPPMETPRTLQPVPTESEYPDPAELTDPLPTATKPQEVWLINKRGSKGGKNSRLKRKETPSPRGTPCPNPLNLYFRCREEVNLPAAPRARTAFIPVELYYRDRRVTAEELRQSCVESRKIVFFHWNLSFETQHKARGVSQWFQHDRRSDHSFPFAAGPAARLYVPKNINVQVKKGCRLGAVAVTVDAGLDRLPEEDAARTSTRSLPPPQHPFPTGPSPCPLPTAPEAYPGPFYPFPTIPVASLRTDRPFPTDPVARPNPGYPFPTGPVASHSLYYPFPTGPVANPSPGYPFPTGTVANLRPGPPFPTDPVGYPDPCYFSPSSAFSSL